MQCDGRPACSLLSRKALAVPRVTGPQVRPPSRPAGAFWFRRHDNLAELRCSTAVALWGEIRRDYSAMPVLRDAR